MRAVAEEQRRRSIQDALRAFDAIAGLHDLKARLRDSTGTGELPPWWSEYFQATLDGAIKGCADNGAAVVEHLEAVNAQLDAQADSEVRS